MTNNIIKTALLSKQDDQIIGYNENEKVNENTEIEKLYHRIDSITKTCSKSYFNKILKKLVIKNLENARIICDYINAEQTEINIKNSTKESRIKILTWLSNHFDDKKAFDKMTKQDILEYLDSIRNIEDKKQRWIGTYNGRQIIFNKFFRWLYNPDEPDSKKRITPSCMNGIKQLPRRDKIGYKPSDMWDSREHVVFLKFCPSKRDRCYHAMAIDTSCRPHELLNLKISDIMFKNTNDGKQYAEILIKGGKTKARSIPLIDSLPFIKDWIQSHPTGDNADSWLFVSQANTTLGSKLTYDGLSYQYKYFYKSQYFPNLLEDKTISESDKSIIRYMLTKPWNLYVFRHSSLTEKSTYLKEHILRTHAGWTMGSKMPQVYLHYFGNESVNSILEAKGVIQSDDKSRNNPLQTKYCNNCCEPNKPETRFCAKCRMVMSYDAYNETIEEIKKKEDRIDNLESEIQIIKESQHEILELLKYPERLAEIARMEIV